MPLLSALAALSTAASQSALPLAGRVAPAAVPVASTASSLVSAVLALILVVALILLLAWVLRRIPGNSFNGSPGLRPVASLALGAKERLMVVEVAGEQLLLGITPSGIHVLHKLSEPLPEAPTPVNFSALLAKRLGAKDQNT